ncbi:unnamed protein product [Linum tenue]|nr:unnamed protein product [Linum tenue]
MGALFAYSASVQLNDPDWYFWFPLYTGACAVNLMNVAAATSNPVSRRIAEVTLWAALFLFCKVVVEDLATGTAGLWSLDLRERVVREKIGSGMVFVSMVLHFKAFPLPEAEGFQLWTPFCFLQSYGWWRNEVRVIVKYEWIIMSFHRSTMSQWLIFRLLRSGTCSIVYLVIESRKQPLHRGDCTERSHFMQCNIRIPAQKNACPAQNKIAARNPFNK